MTADNIEKTVQPTDLPLRHLVRTALDSYLAQLEGHAPGALYDFVLAEVERPLLEAVLAYTQGNQSKAATILGMSRSTLRKKLKDHGID